MMSSAERHFVVAIDGPAGAGKSTVARALALRLGYTFLDTGALYRTVALVAQSNQIPWDDGVRLGDLAKVLEIVFVRDAERTRILADARDVTDAIRRTEISEGASRVSALPEVRAGLLDMQRRAANQANVVAEGRDIGTVVFPSAQAKFFLIANLDTRAQRRTLELQAAGRQAVLAEVLAEMRTRDTRDSGRAAAPLRRADDAIEIDSSLATPEEVIERMIAIVRARGG
ncbi:MAG TPA: (d)CMP kinase [Polyangia bacterium]